MAPWNPKSILLAGILSLLVSGCGRADESGAVPPQTSAAPDPNVVHVSRDAQTELLVEPIQYKPVTQEIIVQGRIHYGMDGFVKLSSPLSGLVKTVRGRLGEAVRANQPLLTIQSADIGTAYSDFAKAESDWQLAQRSFQLASDLYQVKAIPQKEFEQAENDFMKTQAEYQRARGRLRVLKISERELDKPPDQRKLTARFDVKAPLDGIIVEKSVTVGQLVEPAKVLYTIANPDLLQAVGEIYERDLRLIKPGMTASVRVESFPDLVFPATLAYIGDVVDPETRTIKIRCDVTNLEHKLKNDMFVRIHLDVSGQTLALALPQSALIRMGDKTFIFIQHNPEEYERREVVTGPVLGEQIEIQGGARSGERIVVKGGLLLQGALEQ
ncbi:MAG TPA: efflux RND transporter periplasmic adaptor subunit [Nitrospiraceae bacterium]|nr:efflux RND transporter periplasmic adaptor subunit [Nitrospiraceae bacterium]